MTFPRNATDGQETTVGNITFAYQAATRRWKIKATGAANARARQIAPEEIELKAVRPQAINLILTGYNTSVPPSTPVQGDTHIVGPGPSGAFVGHEGQLAIFSQLSGWEYVAPYRGMIFVNPDTGVLMGWSGSAYYEIVGSGGGGGGGASAMAPFSAVNAVLSGNNADLATSAPRVVDGVTLVAGNRVLVIGRAIQSQNGIYTVNVAGTGSNGSWVRAADADEGAEFQPGRNVYAMGGTVLGGNSYAIGNSAAPTINVDPITFVLIGAGGVPAGSIVTEKLANSAVTGAKIAAGAVGTTHIANGAVGAAQLAADSVGSTHIADNAVGAAQIAANAVGAAEIATGAVTSAKLAAGAVARDKISAGAASRLYDTQSYNSAFAWTHTTRPDVRVSLGGDMALSNLAGLETNREYSMMVVNPGTFTRTLFFGTNFNGPDGGDLQDINIAPATTLFLTFIATSATTMMLASISQPDPGPIESTQASLGLLFKAGIPRKASIAFGVGSPAGEDSTSVVQWSPNNGSLWLSSTTYTWGQSGRGPSYLDIHYNGGTQFAWTFVGYQGAWGGDGVNSATPGNVRLRLATAPSGSSLSAKLIV